MRRLALLAFAYAAITHALLAGPIGFVQTNLASDASDASLINPWGLASSSASPFWLGVNGSGISELYNGAGIKQGLVVTIPGAGSVTGVAFGNLANSFNGDTFLFASEDGTLSGWRGALGTAAETLVTGSSANVYKGLTDANIGGNLYAFAANFRTGAIDVFKGNSGTPDLPGKFLDPNLPSGYAPFDVANIGGKLYVTFAQQDADKHDDVPGAGHGIVDLFDLNGNLIQRLATGGVLNSPWGLALAPAGFGDLAGDLLVGNFGDGTIHAFNPTSGALVGTLNDPSGNPIHIDGLWALSFGNGAAAGPATTLFFTAGPNDESGGLFGQLVAAPEPATWFLTGASLLGAIGIRRRVRS